MLGLGEEKNEILQVMDDLISAEVDFFNNRSIFTTFCKTLPFKEICSPRRVCGIKNNSRI